MKTKRCFLDLVVFSIVIGIVILGSVLFLRNEPAITVHFPETIQKVLPSAVHVMCDNWQGSGVAISEEIVVTARHVIDGVNYEITLNDGRKVKGIQALSHRDYDVGFILVDEKILTPAIFGSIKECVLGQSVFIIGSPFGEINFNSVTLGVISGLNRDWDGISNYREPYGWKVVFTSDSGAHPGNSGGPIFSMDGVVRGLLVGGFSPVLNCSMPCDLFLDDIDIVRMMFVANRYRMEEPKIHNYKYYEE